MSFPIVGVGASAGGLETFNQLLQQLPRDTGMAYVLIQHLDPKHESMLTSLLTRTTPMPVVEATDGLAVETNHVYVIPPNTNLGILHGILHYWGGERRGGKRGRGAPGKTPFVAAVQTNDERHPIAMRLTKIKGFRKEEIVAWAQRRLHAASIVVSNGLSCFPGVESAGCAHDAIVTGGGPASVAIEAFTWVNTMIGNVKTSFHGTYHAVSARHLPRYLAEFCYRFNRRFELAAMIPRLGFVATHTPPMPERLLGLAEPWG